MTWARIVTGFLWTIPYLIAGISAPYIFRHTPNTNIGGHYAGALFILSAFWSLYLAFRDDFPGGIKIFYGAVLFLQIIFWSWRFFNDVPLDDIFLLGLSGGQWHSLLTTCYLVVALNLIFFEIKSSTKRASF